MIARLLHLSSMAPPHRLINRRFANVPLSELLPIVTISGSPSYQSDGVLMNPGDIVVVDQYYAQGSVLEIEFTVTEDTANFGIAVRSRNDAAGTYSFVSETPLARHTVTESAGYIQPNGVYHKQVTLTSSGGAGNHRVQLWRHSSHTGVQKFLNTIQITKIS